MREATTTMTPPIQQQPSDYSRPPQALVERLKDHGQEHVVSHWDELSPPDRSSLVSDINSLDLSRLNRIFRRSLQSHTHNSSAADPIDPIPDSAVSTVDSRRLEDRERWWKSGLKLIADGKLAVLLLSGGQGTRLGSSDPKGCFNIGLPSGKSLFQLQAERILSVQKLAEANNPNSNSAAQIQWYIMTSPFTDELTRRFFEAHRFFGLRPEQVTFFRQGTLPCVAKDGRFVMETLARVARAPDGNGGVYGALKEAKLLDDMAARGVKYVDFFGVDNALVRVADPAFLGFFVERGVAAAAKVAKKSYPQEKVGVFARRGKGGSVTVVEYSELDHTEASAVNQQTGRLRHCWANLCLHMFTLEFLRQAADGLENDSVYHLAEKPIPSISSPIPGYKLEQFVFDVFAYAPSTALFEVLREEEFAPVKNANGSLDTPESARLLVLRLHSRWVVAAGGFLTHSVPLYSTGVEVSPVVSYAGENLEPLCRGRTFHAPCEITY